MSWLFGGGSDKKKKEKTTSITDNPTYDGKIPIYDTGRNIDSIVAAFLEKINDSAKEVTVEIQNAIQIIGKKEPLLVLSKGLAVLAKLGRRRKHKVLIMDGLRKIIETNEFKMPQDLSLALAQFTIKEITSDQSINSFWQNSCEQLMISLAKFRARDVVEELLKYFESNKIPHYFIIKSLADYSHRWPEKFLPFVKDVLARTLPLLTSLRLSNMKWVVAASLGRYGENLLITRREGEESNFSEYTGSFLTALQHLINHWMKLKEKQIRLASAEAIGFMSNLIDVENLEELLPKLFEMFPKEMKRERGKSGNMYPVARGLKNVLYIVMKEIPEKIDPFVDTLMATLHQNLVYILQNERYPNQRKCELETLESFALMGQKCFYTDRITEFLSKFYDAGNVFVRVAALRILTHLVKELKTELGSFKESIVTSINIMTTRPDIKVKFQLCLLVENMAQSGYLNVAGGSNLVNIVVAVCSITDFEVNVYCERQRKVESSLNEEQLMKIRKKEKELNVLYLTPSIVRDEGDRVIRRFIEDKLGKKYLDNLLYPFLLENFVKREYDGAFAILCECMHTVAKRKQQDENFDIDFEKNLNLPDPLEILSRLFIKLCLPYERNSSGANILKAMYCLSPNIHEGLVEIWAKKLKEMKRYLDSHNISNYSRDQWQNKVLNLVRESLNSIEDDEWNSQFGKAFENSVHLYNPPINNKDLEFKVKNIREQKKNFLSIYGLITQKTKYRDFVHTAIEKIVLMTDHSIVEERIGCARGLGQSATTHTDSVLTKLQQIMKAKEVGTGGGLFGGKPKKGAITHFTKATALLSYGYVCMLTPIGMIDSRVEVHVVNNILPILSNHKSMTIKQLGLRALDLVAKAVHPSRLKNFKLRSRDDIIKVMLQVISPSDNEQTLIRKSMGNKKLRVEVEGLCKLKILGLEGLRRLILLPPEMKEEVRNNIIINICRFFKYHFGGEYDGLIMENCFNVLGAVLSKETTKGVLNSVLVELENKYVMSTRELERKKGLRAYIFILKEFITFLKKKAKEDGKKIVKKKEGEEEGEEEEEGEGEEEKKKKKKKEEEKKKKKKKEEEEEKKKKKKKGEEEEKEKGLSSYGRILGTFIPRLTESNVEIRLLSFNCLYLIMRINYFLKTKKTDLPDQIKQFKNIKKLLKSTETKEMKMVLKIVTQVYSKIIENYENLVELLETLFDCLEDFDEEGATSSCVLLNGLIRSRGADLHPIVENFVNILIQKMSDMKSRQKIVKGLLYCFKELGKHFIVQVIECLLKKRVPHTVEVESCIQILAADKNLAKDYLHFMIDLMNNDQNYVEQKPTKIVTRVNPNEKNKKNFENLKEREIRMTKYKATIKSLAVLHTLIVIFKMKESKALLLEGYHVMLSSCLIRLGTSHYLTEIVKRSTKEGEEKNVENVSGGYDIKKLVHNSLQLLICFFNTIKDEEVLYEINKKQLFDKYLSNKEEFGGGVQMLLNFVIDEHPDLNRKIFDFLQPFTNRHFIGINVTTLCMNIALLNRIRNDKEMIQVSINELLKKTSSNEISVLKRFSLGGLSNIVCHQKEVIFLYISPIAGSLITCIQDENELISLEAMKSLNKILELVEEEAIQNLLMNLIITLKQKFEFDTNTEIRRNSIILFGVLSRFCEGVMGSIIVKNIHENIPVLLAHLLEDVEGVKIACKGSLQKLSVQLGSKKLIQIVKGYQIQPNSKTTKSNLDKLEIEKYDAFAYKWAKCFVEDFPSHVGDFVMNMSVFFRSKWDGCIISSLLLVGHIFYHLNRKQRGVVNLRHNINALIALLGHRNRVIRVKSSKVLGKLYRC